MESPLETNLKNLTDGDFLLKLRYVAGVFDSHPAYQIGLPEWIYGAQQLREHADLMNQAIEAATKDKSKEAEIAVARDKCARSLHYAVQYVAMFANHRNDPSLLENLGLEFKHKIYAKEKKLPEMPTKLVAKNEEGAGDVLVITNNGIGQKGSIELQINDKEPADESSWKTLDTYFNCRMEIKALEPIRKYYFRVRFRNAVGYGPWSKVVGLVVN
jgi:hypothetical protein